MGNPDNESVPSREDGSGETKVPKGYGGYVNSPNGSYGYGYGYGYGDGKGRAPLLNRSFQDYFFWYIRHFWVLLITGLLGVLYGYYDYSITPPTFQSWAVIEIQRIEKEAADFDEDEKLQLGGSGAIASMIERLKMPAIWEAVARSHLFADRPETRMLSKKHQMPWKVFFGSDESKEKASAGAAPSPTALSFMMKNWLTVRMRPQTAFMDLYAKHTDPEVARDVLNGVLAEYERVSQEDIGASENYAFEFIMEQSDEIKDRILTIERALNRYNRCSVLSNRIEEAELELVVLEQRYLPKWPAVVETKERIRILHDQFSEELEKVLASSEEEQQFWEDNFEVAPDAPREDVIDAQLKLVDSRSNLLQKDLRSEEAILGNLTSRLKEGTLSRGFLAKQFRVVQPPTAGGRVAPNKNAILKKYTVYGLGAGFVIVFLLGLIDPSIRNVGDLEGMTAVPVVGAIPVHRTDKAKKSKVDRELILDERPNSQQAEALRTLRASLTFLGEQSERQTFLITSSLASEGKSWISANLAQAFAQQGDRTLLIDADLRRSVLHSVFGVEGKSVGLTDFLSGKADLKDAIRRTQTNDLYFLPAGSRSPNPAELLSSKKFNDLLPLCEKYFDRIIFDSAPLVLVSDSLSIAKRVQSVLVVYHIGKTPRRALFRSLKYLDANRTSPSGLIANKLPAARTRRAYGYYYSFSGGGGYDGEYGGYGSDDGDSPDSRSKAAKRKTESGGKAKDQSGDESVGTIPEESPKP